MATLKISLTTAVLSATAAWRPSISACMIIFPTLFCHLISFSFFLSFFLKWRRVVRRRRERALGAGRSGERAVGVQHAGGRDAAKRSSASFCVCDGDGEGQHRWVCAQGRRCKQQQRAAQDHVLRTEAARVRNYEGGRGDKKTKTKKQA
jgi:hypothetical protein